MVRVRLIASELQTGIVMARVRFTEKFNYNVTSVSTIVYRAGWEGTVKRECADKAKGAGKAIELPPRGKISNGKTTRCG